jgi:carbonic anhydrase
VLDSDLNLPTILEANRAFAAGAEGPERPGVPAKKLCVLTCMDTRIDPLRALGLSVGDAHILRNGGGRVSGDAVRSIVLSAHELGTREFGVIHHTKCGLFNKTNEAVAAAVAAGGGGDASGIDFLPFDDLDGSVRDDVEALRTCGLLPPDSVVWGAVIDVDSGGLRVVVEPTPVGQ